MNAKKGTLVSVCLVVAIITGACNQNSQPTTSISTPASPVKHYRLKGKVVSIDKQSKMVNVDSEAIPGFMDAMTMPYQVKPKTELDRLHSGDSITADLIVQGDNAWLENVAKLP